MNAPVNMTAAHAVYAPSSASRWTVCTASAEAIANLPEREEGEEAAKGTAAHTEIERRLMPLSRDIKASPLAPDVDHPSAYGVALVVDYVRKLIGVPTIDDRIWIEQRVRLTDQIWGRPDVAHWHAESQTLTVVDFKNGFVGVDVEENEQLRIYAAALMFTHRLPVKWARYALIQPQDFRPVPRVKQGFEPVDTLYAWAEIVAAIPASPKKFVAGEQCTYCPAFGLCPASKDLLRDVGALVAGLMTADQVTPAQRALFIAAKKPIADAFKAAEKIWLKAALAGNATPGMKVVTSQTHRAWLDPVAAKAFVLAQLGTPGLDLPTPAQVIERGIDEATVNAMARAPDGGPVLAYVNDKRPNYVIKTVASMFGDAVRAAAAK